MGIYVKASILFGNNNKSLAFVCINIDGLIWGETMITSL
jgi:hypothetical protein